MSKYKIGERIVLRKDLVVGEYYHPIVRLCYLNEMHMELKDKKYLEILDVDSDDGVYKVAFGWYISDEMISHKYQPSLTKKQRIEKLESDYKLLNEEHAKLLDTVVKLTEQVNKLTNTTPVKMETVENPVVELTPNQKRKQIIDEAEAFVKEVELEYVNVPLHYIVDFKKRTVSANTDVNRRKTTVKCLPEDVFNVHIGKALVLAKRYEMKDEFEKFSNAIQPTEKVEGMKVEIANSIRELVVTGHEVVSGCSCQIGSPIAQKSRIYDDSNAKY